MRSGEITQPRAANGSLLALPDDLYWQQVEARLLKNSERHGECLLWTGRITYSGYGHITIRQRTDNAHRAAYRVWVGEIPAGLEIDHLCRVRNCIEPTHLEAVTREENQRRIAAAKTRCAQGHDWWANSYVSVGGRRKCRICIGNRQRAYRAARKERGK